MKVNAIYAKDLNGKMGTSDGRLPWRVPPFCDDPEIAAFAKRDMENFKKTTTGNIVIMGYNTYLTFENPLPNRWNCVIDRNCEASKKSELPGQDDWLFFPSIENCLEVLGELEKSHRDSPFPKVFVIGGAKLLAECRAKNLLNGEILETVFPWKF